MVNEGKIVLKDENNQIEINGITYDLELLVSEGENIVKLKLIDKEQINRINVNDGYLTIKSNEITYKHNGIGETEIKSWNEDTRQMDKPIQLSEEIIKSISENDATEITLNYGYLLDGEKALKINTEIILNEGLLITGDYINKIYDIISITKDGKLTIGNDSDKVPLFGIMGVNFDVNDDTNRSYLLYNQGETIINTENTLILGNRLFFKNNFYLFFNYKTLTINSKNIYIINNILNSTKNNSALFGNWGTLDLGSNKTETIRIEGNEIKGKYNSTLLYNNYSSILNINGSNISIRNNTISKYKDENYYAIYNAGTMNINLYYNNDYNNPTFEISGNKTTKADKKLTEDIYLGEDSKLNFINNSNDEVKIKLENGIGGKGFITFENNDNNENGSFKLKNTYIEANNINIESNVTLLLTINIEGLLGGLKVYSDGSNLTISGDKQLIIELQKIEDTDKPQDVIL